ncbi:MAG: 2-oxo acid dehydrogenase subunit E2 [Firmicutes bacterium]|jgi:pyruvate dehydrogenase E2 component (dihydrolipoamide acetyltransferase)|nr:2-oxo acid dehydrogenase subunit E2 [Bacillota bacterium]
MFEVKFADIGEGIHEGILYKWSVDIGEDIEEGQTLYLIETDKVTAEIPSPIDGKVHNLMFEIGDKINVGDTVLTIDDGNSGESFEEEKKESTNVKEKGSTSVVGEIEVSSKVIKSSSEKESVKSESRPTLATPVARKMAKDLGIDIKMVKGTGTNGRVMKDDIRKYHEEINSSNVKSESKESNAVTRIENKAEGDKVIHMSEIRKAISRNMEMSKKNIPHAGAFDEIDVTRLQEYRKKIAQVQEEYGVKITYLPYIIKAIVNGIKKNPIINSRLDQEKQDIILKHDINIGIAVDTKKGLVVPVISDAEKKSILELAKEIEALTLKAREGKLSIEDISHGTFSVTNYGSIGTSFGMPIIKYPEVAILGIGRIEEKVRVIDGKIVPRTILPVSMAFDHRVIDGADAGRFMNEIKALLENPDKLLLN